MVDLKLSRREVKRIVASLRKAAEWDDSSADSMVVYGRVVRGWARRYSRAIKSAQQNNALAEKIAQALWDQRKGRT